MPNRTALLYATTLEGPQLIALIDELPFDAVSQLLDLTHWPQPRVIRVQATRALPVPDRLAFGTTLYTWRDQAWQATENTITMQIRLATHVKLHLGSAPQPWIGLKEALKNIPGATYFPQQQRLHLTTRWTLSVAPQLDVVIDTLVQRQQRYAQHLMHALSLPIFDPQLELNTDISLRVDPSSEAQ